MKNKEIALFLALGLASGIMCVLPVLAGEAAEQGIESVQETILAAEKTFDRAGSEKGYAVSAEAADDTVDSGLCGEEAAWTLTGSGDNLTLTFSGSGSMDDYEESNVPWESYRGRIKKVVIEEGITSVGDCACFSMDQLTEVSLPDSLESIGFSGFENCKALKNVAFPKNLEIINGEAFLGCSALTELVFPDGLITIDDYAFTGCSSLTSITVPDSVARIGDFSFRDCDQLSRIDISDLASWLLRGELRAA